MKVSMNARSLCAALILASLHAIAHAQLFKCKGANGHYSFQDTPCAVQGRSQDRKQPRPGDRDESFAQKTNGNSSGANWEPRQQTFPEDHLSSPAQTARTHTHATGSPTAASSRKSLQEKEQEYQQRRVERQEQETKAYNDKAKAFNQMQRCNYARQQLGVVEGGHPVYSVDNNGNRHYVDDENRQAKITAAEQRVADACK